MDLLGIGFQSISNFAERGGFGFASMLLFFWVQVVVVVQFLCVHVYAGLY